MITTEVSLEEEQLRELQLLAQRRDTTVAALLQEGAAEVLARHARLREAIDRALEVAGKYRSSGPGDVAENHDEYLADAFHDW